ncbi:hypothetical protein JS533_001120 [Bifidobacterium amazonense]|uniref:Uncharacterized protein n=1 Tax=Bifidobacterium amazonense TaxID=2809027 RepID=A0ABS9VS29_9BIFI|nr:hypothetical protein [Bifidobacterium amazonense]MCH9274889.1 hypothetical protein [Bifidobacterium amazonense]
MTAKKETTMEINFTITDDGKAVAGDRDKLPYPRYSYELPDVEGLPYVYGPPSTLQDVADIAELLYCKIDYDYIRQRAWEDLYRELDAYHKMTSDFYDYGIICGLDRRGWNAILEIEWMPLYRHYPESSWEDTTMIPTGYEVDLGMFAEAHPQYDPESPEYDPDAD